MSISRDREAIIGGLSPQKPTLIVSLTGANPEELEAQYRQLPAAVDIIEWRIDKILNHCRISELEKIAKYLGNIVWQPILATVRTVAEGGDSSLNFAEYLQLIRKIADFPEVAMIDLELSESYSLAELKILVQVLKKKNIVNIFSKHFFTPSEASKILEQGMESILDDAFLAGADIAKLAIWIENREYLLKLLQQTYAYHSNYPKRKILIIGMGPVGQSSRLIGGIFGSCGTFAAIPASRGQKSVLASAPGQLPADLMTQVLQALHGENLR